MSQADRDSRRGRGVATSGTFRTLVSARVPGTESSRRTVGGYEEKFIRLAIDAEVPPGGSVSGLYRSGPDPLSLGPQQSDPALVEQNERYVEIEGTLTSDGIEPVRIPPGGAAATYALAQPTLLRADRSCLFGGSVITGSSRSYDRSDYRTDPVAGKARPVPITGRVGRADAFEVHVFTPEAEVEFKRTMLDTEWIREYPAANVIERLMLYEIAEGSSFETELLEEIVGFVYTSFSVSRAEVLESGQLR